MTKLNFMQNRQIWLQITEKVLAEVRAKEELQVQFRPNGSRYFFHETNLQKISEMEK